MDDHGAEVDASCVEDDYIAEILENHDEKLALPGIADGTTSLAVIQALPDSVQDVVVAAFAHATGVAFLAAVPLMLVAFGLTLMLPEIRLRKAGETEHFLADGPVPPLPVTE